MGPRRVAGSPAAARTARGPGAPPSWVTCCWRAAGEGEAGPGLFFRPPGRPPARLPGTTSGRRKREAGVGLEDLLRALVLASAGRRVPGPEDTLGSASPVSLPEAAPRPSADPWAKRGPGGGVVRMVGPPRTSGDSGPPRGESSACSPLSHPVGPHLRLPAVGSHWPWESKGGAGLYHAFLSPESAGADLGPQRTRAPGGSDLASRLLSGLWGAGALAAVGSACEGPDRKRSSYPRGFRGAHVAAVTEGRWPLPEQRHRLGDRRAGEGSHLRPTW